MPKDIFIVMNVFVCEREESLREDETLLYWVVMPNIVSLVVHICVGERDLGRGRDVAVIGEDARSVISVVMSLCERERDT